jgi:hypothetical protein
MEETDKQEAPRMVERLDDDAPEEPGLCLPMSS